LLKATSVADVDTFIKQATKIIDKLKRNSKLSVEAKQEACVLLEQFEKCLEARLRVSNNHVCSGTTPLSKNNS
jgi:hypothetical protein